MANPLDKIAEKYQKGENAADSLLLRLVSSPWSLAALVAYGALAFALGAWLL